MALPRLINVGGPRQKSEFLIPGTIATSSFRLLHENDLLHELGDNRSEDKHSKDISENREDLANVYFLKVEWQPHAVKPFFEISLTHGVSDVTQITRVR